MSKLCRSSATLVFMCAVASACGGEDNEPEDPADARVPIDAAGFSDASTQVDGGGSQSDGGVVVGADIEVAPARADGQVVAPWDKYCVVTFTRDFTVKSFFGETELLPVKAGARYLQGAGGSYAQIIYIADEAVAELRVDPDDAGLPYTSSCTGNRDERFGVIVDTTIYSDAELTIPVCIVQAGQLLPETGHSIGYAGAGYAVEMSGLGSVCGGITMGYVRETQVELPGGTAWSIPLVQVAVPPS